MQTNIVASVSSYSKNKMDPNDPMPVAGRAHTELLFYRGDFTQLWCVQQNPCLPTTLHKKNRWYYHAPPSAIWSQYAVSRLPAAVLDRPLIVEKGGVGHIQWPSWIRLTLAMLHIPMKIAIDGCQIVPPGYNNTQGGISKLYNNQIGKGGI